MSTLDDVLATIKALADLPTLEPDRVAAILGRRLEIVKESDAGVNYRLVGDVEFPFGAAELRWGRRRPGAFLYVEMSKSLRLGMREVQVPWWNKYPFSSMPADPRSPDQRKLILYKVPVGELRLLHPGWDQDFVLDAFSLSETPLVQWPVQGSP